MTALVNAFLPRHTQNMPSEPSIDDASPPGDSLAVSSAPQVNAGPDIPQSWLTWLGGILLVLMVAGVYWPTLENGFVSDDGTYLTHNKALETPEGLWDIWFKLGTTEQYYPLVHTSFWLEYRVWELQPRGYHAVNMLLHAMAVLLAWRLLARLAVPGAWLAAALFAVHPVEVESVAWVSERKNLLSCCFALGSLLAYFRFAPPEKLSPDRAAPSRRWGFYALALALFAAALLSKSVTASVPAVVLVIVWWKRGRLAWSDFAPLVPFFAVGLAMAGLTVYMEEHYVGARGDDFNFSIAERVLIAGRALWFYAAKLVWPQPLIFYYPQWKLDASAWWQYVFPLGALAVLVALWLERESIGRGPLAAALIFAGVLTPALGFFNVFPFRLTFVADHYQYHASLALFALAAAIISQAATRSPNAGWLILCLTGGGLLALGATSWQRTHVYRDSESLETDTVTQNPKAFASHINLGAIATEQGRLDDAIGHYSEAVIAKPEFVRARNNLASSLYAAGRVPEAERFLLDSLTLPADDADKAGAHVLMQLIRIDQSRFDDVIEHCCQALALQPRDAFSLYNYGRALRGKGQTDEAIEMVRKSIEIDPQSSAAHHELGTLLSRKGKLNAAAGHLRTAVQIRPSTFQLREDLAAVLISLTRLDEAEQELRFATRLNRKSPRAHFLLGLVAIERGKRDDAIHEFQETLKLNPTHREAEEYLQRLGAPRP